MACNEQFRDVDASYGAMLLVIVEYHRSENRLIYTLADNGRPLPAFQIIISELKSLLNRFVE